MARTRPNPEGWKGGSEEFGMIRTLDGHIAQTKYGVDDGRSHRNATKSLEDSDLGGEGYGLGEGLY